MKMQIGVGLLLAAAVFTAAQTPQNAADTPEAHVAVAQTAAGEDYQNLFNFMCAAPGQRGGARGAGGAGGAGGGGGGGGGAAAGAPRGQGGAAGAPRGQGGGGQRAAPDRSTWYAEPLKVFDNFYFVGQTEYSVWAITTSQGIILIDTIFEI